MLIPHLHFCGNCEEAIAIYEKAFNTKAESIDTIVIMHPMNIQTIIK